MSPLVSVLIRTMGRPCLERSVQAALAQVHRPLEIVVVNAGAGPLPPLPQAHDVAIRVVEGGPYDRPRAANAALANAKGEWLVFLDEDDSFAPTHVESLLGAVRRAPGARVAYSETLAIEANGRPSMVIGAHFDRIELFTGNYIAISAALFSRSLVEAGARFDESLASFEDWDFFIQLAQMTPFAFTAQATNFYNAHAGQSGAGLGANKREQETRRFHDMVVAKWAARAQAMRSEVQRHQRAAREAAARREPRYEQRHLAEVARLRTGALAGDMRR